MPAGPPTDFLRLSKAGQQRRLPAGGREPGGVSDVVAQRVGRLKRPLDRQGVAAGHTTLRARSRVCVGVRCSFAFGWRSGGGRCFGRERAPRTAGRGGRDRPPGRGRLWGGGLVDRGLLSARAHARTYGVVTHRTLTYSLFSVLFATSGLMENCKRGLALKLKSAYSGETGGASGRRGLGGIVARGGGGWCLSAIVAGRPGGPPRSGPNDGHRAPASPLVISHACRCHRKRALQASRRRAPGRARETARTASRLHGQNLRRRRDERALRALGINQKAVKEQL